MPQRKNAFKLSVAEQDTFKRAVTAMIADGTYLAQVKIHSDMSHHMHTMASDTARVGTWRFLSWHRAYLIHMEAELVKKESAAFIPYWHWVDGGVPDWLKTFKPTVDGVVNQRNDLTTSITDAARIATLMTKTDYFDFSYALELDPHNQGHIKLGSPMRSVPIAPSDPIFWMHHGEVDRVWADWQAANPGKAPILTGADAIMDPWTDTVSSLASISALGYSYA